MADELSPLPTLSTEQAVAWLASHGVTVTATYLTNARRTGQLVAAIVAGKRRYSTQALWDFIVQLPSSTNRGRNTK
jgi:hypothetical protein